MNNIWNGSNPSMSTHTTSQSRGKTAQHLRVFLCAFRTSFHSHGGKLYLIKHKKFAESLTVFNGRMPVLYGQIPRVAAWQVTDNKSDYHVFNWQHRPFHLNSNELSTSDCMLDGPMCCIVRIGYWYQKHYTWAWPRSFHPNRQRHQRWWRGRQCWWWWMRRWWWQGW